MKKIGKLKLLTSIENDFSLASIGFECLDREMFKPEKCYDTIGKTGVKRARVQTGWVKCEKEKGIYDFKWLDDIVNNLLCRGIEPWFNVTYGNPLYMDNVSSPYAVGCVPVLYGEEAVKAWLDYVNALAEHYKDTIKYFEIWNEPNHPGFWYPGKPDPTEYAHLIEITGDVIRKIIPDCKIGGCSASVDHEFIRQTLSNVKVGHIDFYCIHPYMMEPEAGYFEAINMLRLILKESGHVNCEIWQGEAGFPSWFPENHYLKPKTQSSERQQAVWLLRRFFLDAFAQLKVSNYFQMADMWEKTYSTAAKEQKKPAAQGIVNGITYTPKKACYTISVAANLFSGNVKPIDCRMNGDYEAVGDGQKCRSMLFSFICGSKPFFAYYVPFYIQDEVSVRNGYYIEIGKESLENFSGDYVLTDTYTGDVFEINPTYDDDTVVRFSDLPFADYPMVICSRDTFRTEAL